MTALVLNVIEDTEKIKKNNLLGIERMNRKLTIKNTCLEKFLKKVAYNDVIYMK